VLKRGGKGNSLTCLKAQPQAFMETMIFPTFKKEIPEGKGAQLQKNNKKTTKKQMRASWFVRAGSPRVGSHNCLPHVSWLGRAVPPARPLLSRTAIAVKLRTITSTASGPHQEIKDDDHDTQKTWMNSLTSQFGTLVLATIVASLIFQLARQRGEHKEYKRTIERRLQEAQDTLQQQQAQIHRIIETKKEELEAIDPSAESEEIKKQVNQLLATLASEADVTLTTGPLRSDAAKKRGNGRSSLVIACLLAYTEF